jgi:RNA polymerase sigma factor (sigma-70 family)
VIKTNLNECELVHLLKDKNQSAFNHLYHHYYRALYKIIHQIVSDEDAAADVLQKVFVNVWQRIDGYESSKGRLFTWMLNIARNAAIDTVRSRSYQSFKKQVYLPDDYFINLSDCSYYLSIDSIGIEKYVARLKPSQRMLIELVYYHGYSHPEVAAMQAIPLSTIKTRVRTAISQLRMLIGREN